MSTLVQKKKEEITTNTAAAKAHRDAVTAKMGDVALKETALKKADARLKRAEESFQAATDTGDKQTAKKELDLATADFENARIDLEAARKALEVARATIYEDPAAKQVERKNVTLVEKPLPSARGPVMYRIAENQATGGIQLVEVPWQLFSFNGQLADNGRQLKFETQGKKPDSGDATNKPEKPKPLTAKFIVDTYKYGDQTITVRFTKPVQTLHNAECKITNVGTEEDANNWVTLAKTKSGDVTMAWKKDTPKAGYTASLALSFEGVGDQKAAVEITVK